MLLSQPFIFLSVDDQSIDGRVGMETESLDHSADIIIYLTSATQPPNLP